MIIIAKLLNSPMLTAVFCRRYGGILTITLVALISAVAPEDMASAVGGSYLFRATVSFSIYNVKRRGLTPLIYREACSVFPSPP